jgi:hypothetical protein
LLFSCFPCCMVCFCLNPSLWPVTPCSWTKFDGLDLVGEL